MLFICLHNTACAANYSLCFNTVLFLQHAVLTTWPHLVLSHAAVTAGTKVGRKAPGCYDSLLLLPLFLCLPFSEWPSICAHALWSWSAQIRLPSPYSVWVGRLVCWRGHTAKKQLAASLVLSNKVILSKSKMVTKRILKIPCVVIELGQLRSHQKLSLLICVPEKLSDIRYSFGEKHASLPF